MVSRCSRLCRPLRRTRCRFRGEGRGKVRELKTGERSRAFLPRPAMKRVRIANLRRHRGVWCHGICELQPSLPCSPNLLSGVVRLDIAAVDDWHKVIDDVSWAVLDDFMAYLPGQTHART